MATRDPMQAGARWLITGARGQLGRTLCALLPARGIEVVAADRARLDVTDVTAVARELETASPDAVIHCAAFTHVDGCEQEPELAQRVNGDAPAALAGACRDRCLLVSWSTDYVFDGQGGVPWREEDEPRPLSVYGRTKLAGEQGVREAGGEHLIARTQWVIGPGANFVRTILGAAREGRELRVVDDQIGRPSTTVALAEGLLTALEAGARGTLHLACEGIASWYDLACDAVAQGARRGLCPEVPVTPIPTAQMPRPAARPAFGVLDLARARALGVRMPHWRTALSDYLDAEREDGR